MNIDTDAIRAERDPIAALNQLEPLCDAFDEEMAAIRELRKEVTQQWKQIVEMHREIESEKAAVDDYDRRNKDLVAQVQSLKSPNLMDENNRLRLELEALRLPADPYGGCPYCGH